jgi:hypothetical protein
LALFEGNFKQIKNIAGFEKQDKQKMQVFITQLQLMEKEENDYLDEKKFKEK